VIDKLTEQTIQEMQDAEFRLSYGEELAKVDFAQALVEARKARNLTQHQLAGLLGVRQPYIAKLERGEANPTIATVGRIFAAMWSRLVWEPKGLPFGERPDSSPTPMSQTGSTDAAPTNTPWGRAIIVDAQQAESSPTSSINRMSPRPVPSGLSSARIRQPNLSGTADDCPIGLEQFQSAEPPAPESAKREPALAAV
jgi:transcriptional regulator with XRE-family HTH domain